MAIGSASTSTSAESSESDRSASLRASPLSSSPPGSNSDDSDDCDDCGVTATRLSSSATDSPLALSPAGDGGASFCVSTNTYSFSSCAILSASVRAAAEGGERGDGGLRERSAGQYGNLGASAVCSASLWKCGQGFFLP